MKRRCPTAEVLGTSTLHGYRLVFNGVATIEPDPDSSVPVLLWDIKPADEIPLDRYEGYPQLYRRETVQVKLNGKTVDAMNRPKSTKQFSGSLKFSFRHPTAWWYCTL